MINDTSLTITGNLAADPEVRYTPAGQAVTAFTVAATPRYQDRTGRWRDGDALFLRCTAWRDLAEHIAESLTRGTRVVVTGRLRQRSYETPQGERHTVIELTADEAGPSLRFATARVTRAARATATADDDIPPGNGSPEPRSGAPADDGDGPAAVTAPARAGAYDEPPF